jgi:hypothetical protein
LRFEICRSTAMSCEMISTTANGGWRWQLRAI